MSRLSTRLKRIEAAVKPGGCGTCNGRWTVPAKFYDEGDELPPISDCPECGRKAEGIAYIVIGSAVYPDGRILDQFGNIVGHEPCAA